MKQILWIFVGSLMLTTAQAASFDCSKTRTNIEKIICSDKALSFYDERLNFEYKEKLESSSDCHKLAAEQKSWLKVIRNSCKDVQCLLNAYVERIEALAEQPEDEYSFMDSPVILGCDETRSFMIIQASSQSGTSYYESQGYKTSELLWNDLVITGNKAPNDNTPFRKGSKSRTQSCGSYKVEVKHGYLNDDPMGYQGYERFPQISIYLGAKTLVQSLALGYDSIVSLCPDGNPMRIFVYPAQLETSPQIYIERTCFDEENSKNHREVVIK